MARDTHTAGVRSGASTKVGGVSYPLPSYQHDHAGQMPQQPKAPALVGMLGDQANHISRAQEFTAGISAALDRLVGETPEPGAGVGNVPDRPSGVLGFLVENVSGVQRLADRLQHILERLERVV